MKPCLSLLLLLFSLPLSSQTIKKTVENHPVFSSLLIEKHFDRQASLTKQVNIYNGVRADSIQYEYLRDESGRILKRKTISKEEWTEYDIYQYEDGKLAKTDHYAVISPLVRLSEPIESLPHKYHNLTTYGYDKRDSLVRKAEYWDLSTQANRETLYTWKGDTSIITIKDQHEMVRITTADTDTQRFYERASFMVPDGETLEHEVVFAELDKSGQVTKQRTWNRHRLGTKGASGSPATYKGKPGFELISRYQNTLDEAGNLIKQEISIGEVKNSYERQIEYYD